MSKELIHLMADASFCPITKKAAYGFSIKSAIGVLRGSRDLTASDSFEAELRAIGQTLDLAVRCNQLTSNAILLVKSDNRGVIEYLSGGSVKRTDLVGVLNEIFAITKQFNLKIHGQHVRGHSKKQDPKYVLQRTCDSMARTQLKKARQVIA